MNRAIQTLFAFRVGLLLAGACCGARLTAQEPRVRASLEEADEVWTGQKVTLVVELLAPGYFASAPSFDLPEPNGVLLVPPMDRPVVGRETVDDVDYTVQRHEFFAYPMRAGDLTIPALGARFAFKRAPLDTNTVAATLTTPPQNLKVTNPPGAADLGLVISARDLKLQESWQPEPTNAPVKAGAAFVRTLTFTAPDVPGMVFPPFPAGPIDGLGIYAKHALQDRIERGTMQGERQDSITYLCQQPGQFTIPATRFIWFDLAAKQLRTNDLPARTLNVIANPAYASTTDAASPGWAASRITLQWWLSGLLAAVVLYVVARRTGWLLPLFASAIAPFRPLPLQPLNPQDPSR